MKRAVVYGSGKIGRGFIGKKFADSGFEVCFLDKVQALIDALNDRRAYTVRVVFGDDAWDSTVPVARALNSLTDEAVEAIAGCDLMATAVGVNELPNIAPIVCLLATPVARRCLAFCSFTTAFRVAVP